MSGGYRFEVAADKGEARPSPVQVYDDLPSALSAWLEALLGGAEYAVLEALNSRPDDGVVRAKLPEDVPVTGDLL